MVSNFKIKKKLKKNDFFKISIGLNFQWSTILSASWVQSFSMFF